MTSHNYYTGTLKKLLKEEKANIRIYKTLWKKMDKDDFMDSILSEIGYVIQDKEKHIDFIKEMIKYFK